MILTIAAAIASAQPAPCPDIVTAEAFVCRAIHASADQKPDEAAEAFEHAAQQLDPSDPQVSRLYAAAGNSWISAGQPGKAALDLDRALAGPGLQAEQRGEALLDRARSAEAQNDLKTARDKVTEATQTISSDPFLWFFSAALAIREGNTALATSSINRALSIAPADPMILFEAGHVAQFGGDDVGARNYWQRTIERDPNGEVGKQAREALKLLPVPLTVQGTSETPK
jgi:tetratricopeptide (TPR) repeat protein